MIFKTGITLLRTSHFPYLPWDPQSREQTHQNRDSYTQYKPGCQQPKQTTTHVLVLSHRPSGNIVHCVTAVSVRAVSEVALYKFMLTLKICLKVSITTSMLLYWKIVHQLLVPQETLWKCTQGRMLQNEENKTNSETVIMVFTPFCIQVRAQWDRRMVKKTVLQPHTNFWHLQSDMSATSTSDDQLNIALLITLSIEKKVWLMQPSNDRCSTLQNGTPVSPYLGKTHANFGFALHFFPVKRQYKTDR